MWLSVFIVDQYNYCSSLSETLTHLWPILFRSNKLSHSFLCLLNESPIENRKRNRRCRGISYNFLHAPIISWRTRMKKLPTCRYVPLFSINNRPKSNFMNLFDHCDTELQRPTVNRDSCKSVMVVHTKVSEWPRDITQGCHTCESPASGDTEASVVQFELLLWD